MTARSEGSERSERSGQVSDWECLSERTVYRNRFHLVSRVYRLPSGAETDFEVAEAPEVVSIVCVTTDEQVVLARQFRAGPGRVLGELPGGCVEPGESHEAAAARELVEETGYAGDMQYVGSIWHAANSTVRMHVYTCTNAQRVAALSPDEFEFIEPVLVSLDEFRAHLRGGQLTALGSAYLGLDALNLL